MKKAKRPEAPRQKRKLCYGRLLSGGALLGMSAGAMAIDVMNNVSYGWKTEPVLGAVFGLGAIGLTVIPMAAARDGWNMAMRAGTLVCAVVTIAAAASAYMETQGAELDHKQGASLAYETAQANAAAAGKELADARAEAAAIAEMASVADLQAIVQTARDLAQTEAKDRGGRGKLAKAHEDKVQATLDRIPEARRREAAVARAEKAQALIDAAQGEAKGGPVEVSKLGSAVARYIGGTSEEAAKQIAMAMSALAITLTVILALLAEKATKLIIAGIGTKPEPMKEEAAPDRTEERAARKLAMLAAMSNQERIDHFVQTIAKPLIEAQPMTAKALYEALAQWWLERLPGIPAPSQRKLAERMKVAQLPSVKLSGARVYGAVEMAA